MNNPFSVPSHDCPATSAVMPGETAGEGASSPVGNGERLVPAILPRVGIGTDAHAFADFNDADNAARPCMVAGLSWPGEPPLKGHSDADVAAHALCDAILSAAGQGDLGTHFGTNRPEWQGASGKQLLEATMEIIHQAGWELGNAAVQVIANRPRMGKRYDQARAVLEEAVGAPVSVSATTSDYLGFTGRGEGAAAVATALVYPLGRN